jgi:hypothetical protein
MAVADHSGYRTRRANESDAAALADVWLRSRRASVPAIPSTVHRDDEVRDWFATIVVPEYETWVVEENHRIVALLVLRDGWIDQLYVDRPARAKASGRV